MKFVMVALFFTACLLLPRLTDAHSIGQPPYFKVNGVFTDYYPVPSTSLDDFELPQDLANGQHFVGENLEFLIDETALPVPKETVEKTKFIWDFGDGVTAQGLKNTHTYTKPSTYFLSIKADSGEGFEPQLLQTTAINILPNKDYRLPKAVIEISGKQSGDPLLDVLEVDFKKEVTFDASKSDAGSSEITEYFWDLGDQTSKNYKTFTYLYKENPYAVFPLLRVKTKDGFIADSFVQLSDKNAYSDTTGNQNPITALPDWKILTVSALFSLVLTATIFWGFKKITSKR